MEIQHSMASLAGSYTRLVFNDRTKKYHGRCPFCRSAAETFCVDNKNGTFWCYSCGRHGTLDDFRFQMGLADPEPATEPEDQEAMAICEEAAGFYYRCLTDRSGARAYAYITKDRGLDAATVAGFGIGYAPCGSGNQALYRFLRENHGDAAIFRSGLVKQGRYGAYDMFRDRVMFPIMNRSGRVVGFGGRCMEGDGPKYINSAESRIFNKHALLYGFQTAEAAAASADALVVCEGYMDLIALQAHGVRNSAAVLGTALTPDHATLIRSRYRHVRLALDSDGPGTRAIARSIPVLESAGLTVDTVNFKPAKDPDEFYRMFGAEALQERAASGTDPSIAAVRGAAGPETELIRQLAKRVHAASAAGTVIRNTAGNEAGTKLSGIAGTRTWKATTAVHPRAAMLQYGV